MTLPLTNQTFHLDASTNANIWKFRQAGTPYHNTPAADGDNVEACDADNGIAYRWTWELSAAEGATYKVNAPYMQHPALRFNGTSEYYRLCPSATTSNQQTSRLFTAGAKTLLVAFYADVITRNEAFPGYNHSIVGDDNAAMGLMLRNAGSGVYKLVAMNNDGTRDYLELNVTKDAPHVACMRHNGTNLYLSLDGGTEVSMASGNTSAVTGSVMLGTSADLVGFFSGEIGEIATYNVALSGSTLTDAIAELTAKWLAPTVQTYNLDIEHTATATLDAEGHLQAHLSLAHSATVIHESASVATLPANITHTAALALALNTVAPTVTAHHRTPPNIYGNRDIRGRGSRFRAHGPYHWPPIPEHKRYPTS